MNRSPAQRRAWRALSPHKRRILTSHRPDYFEGDMALRSSIMTALENVYGPRQWDATVAVLAEGEAEAVDYPAPSDGEPDGMTLAEIGDHFGVSSARIMQIIAKALRKLRSDPIAREMIFGHVAGYDAGAVDAALRRVHEQELDLESGAAPMSGKRQPPHVEAMTLLVAMSSTGMYRTRESEAERLSVDLERVGLVARADPPGPSEDHWDYWRFTDAGWAAVAVMAKIFDRQRAGGSSGTVAGDRQGE